ncbi:MAG: hypothetical protein UT43_C0028G0001, partial [Parcubacteria group bacterium GW2011_GWC1_39_29]
LEGDVVSHVIGDVLQRFLFLEVHGRKIEEVPGDGASAGARGEDIRDVPQAGRIGYPVHVVQVLV